MISPPPVTSANILLLLRMWRWLPAVSQYLEYEKSDSFSTQQVFDHHWNMPTYGAAKCFIVASTPKACPMHRFAKCIVTLHHWWVRHIAPITRESTAHKCYILYMFYLCCYG
eukprot:GEMP01104806.1.p1 GENE.GEMP01104806.1~~GEMP01104806.1.p1  ORF type:complete len:112 (-),score=12.17 GEMP01104806.1:115-450(-)